MRFPLVAAAVALATGFSARTASTRAGSPTTVLVRVDLRCTPTGASYIVDPWSVTLRQDDSIEWALYAGAHADELVIAPRNPAAWPFASTQFRGDREKRPYGRDMRAGGSGHRYPYDVLMVCKGAVTRPDTIRIDPEIIIQ